MVDAKGLVSTEEKLKCIVDSIPRRSSVRTSPFCNDIVSMRLKGFSYREIEDWLATQGEQYRIPAGTLNRLLLKTPIGESEFVWITEIEKRGGDFEVDITADLRKQIYLQRLRINTLAKRELKKRETIEDYVDKRIQQELLLFLEMLKSLQEFTKVEEIGEQVDDKSRTQLTPKAKAEIEEMILSGELQLTKEKNETLH